MSTTSLQQQVRKAQDNGITRLVTFIQNDEPPLKVGEYALSVTQTTNTEAPNNFNTTRNFAVTGERFSFASGEIDSVFPPNLANGEFDGVLPNVVFNRRTLPWERYLDTSNDTLPWLAILLFDATNKPEQKQATASDLIQLGQTITVLGNNQLTGIGKLPNNIFSYPDINPLDYGETPDDICSVIDVDLAVFNQIAPSMNDMGYLAHIRQVDTIDSVANTDEETIYSVVTGNRIGQNDLPSFAYLVSLENMGPYLPSDTGVPATFPAGINSVRLICYQSWSFTANTLDQNFQNLLENLNQISVNNQILTTLQFPSGQTAPSNSDVENALAAQAQGTITSSQANTLVLNAFNQGYIPMNHEMRHGNTSVSWYRGPCAPYIIAEQAYTPETNSDALNRYNPQTGLFDVSYGAAWQLGQLMALQNKNYANALFNWKKAVTADEANQAEQAILEAALSESGVFDELVQTRALALGDSPPLPDIVTTWLAELKLLVGVPFNYLVPNDQMLPLESIRFFYLDLNWINALIDGAFSIGRTCSRQTQQDQQQFMSVRNQAFERSKHMRKQRKTQTYQSNNNNLYMGFIMRSQVLPGWPNLQVNGYAVADDITTEVKKLRMARLSTDSLICIFDGTVAQVAIHEPPEQLHCGIELNTNPYSTTLRAVTGPTPGSQFTVDPKGGPATANISLRTDNQTLAISQTAQNILLKLNTDFAQNIQDFTSAEFTLEMIKGVVKVNFNQKN